MTTKHIAVITGHDGKVIKRKGPYGTKEQARRRAQRAVAMHYPGATWGTETIELED